VVTTTDFLVTTANYTVFCNPGASNRTITLPSAAGNGGRMFVVRRIGGGSSLCNVTPVHGGTLALDDGPFDRRAITVQSDGATWWVIGESYF
jgi:hypothetical protein